MGFPRTLDAIAELAVAGRKLTDDFVDSGGRVPFGRAGNKLHLIANSEFCDRSREPYIAPGENVRPCRVFPAWTRCGLADGYPRKLANVNEIQERARRDDRARGCL